MSYRATSKTEVVCDGCRKVKPELMAGGTRKWTVWEEEGKTKHNCPDCIDRAWAENPG